MITLPLWCPLGIFVLTINRVVDKILVSVGQKVKERQILFTLESNDLEADLLSRTFALENSIAKLKKLESLPRKEDIAIAQAALKSAKIGKVEP